MQGGQCVKKAWINLFAKSMWPTTSSTRLSTVRWTDLICGMHISTGYICINEQYSTQFVCLFLVQQPPVGRGPSFTRFLDHTKRRTTVGRTPLDEWSARRRDLYLTTHNTHNRQTSMFPTGFEPTIPASKRPQTCVIDRAATGIGTLTLRLPD